jgi:23S rRNA (cytidine1920-2'-O)/16S rRNA (cytidine1409-2'-O)-methyltransferase
MSKRLRADHLLMERAFVESRARAQELIRRGRVSANGEIVTRPSQSIDTDAVIVVAEARSFVSRGGEKLDGALDVLGVDLSGAVVVDIGASTGGFTDAALKRGARKVYAVDVGHDQFHPSLRSDPRVVVRERTNARRLQPGDFDEPVTAVLVDASFIGLEKLLDAIAGVLTAGGILVALVKPQFEVGRAVARRTRGVVRDPEERERAIDAVRSALRARFDIAGECDSSLPGPRGNVERFVYARLRPHRAQNTSTHRS